jgi:hypothetical protein
MILRTMFLCSACAAKATTVGVLPRIVIDSVQGARYSVLGCPICGSHDLKVESIAPAPAAEAPAPAPAPAPVPAPALPSPGAANDTVTVHTAVAAPSGIVLPITGARAPVIAQSEAEAKEKKADFIQLPSRVRCAETGCGEELTFDVKESMTDVLTRAGWKSVPPRGTLCGKHATPAEQVVNE